MREYINEKLKESLENNLLQASCFLSKEVWRRIGVEGAKEHVRSYLSREMSCKIVERHFEKIEPFGDDFQGVAKVVVLTPEEFKRHLMECYEAGKESTVRVVKTVNVLSISELERLESDC